MSSLEIPALVQISEACLRACRHVDPGSDPRDCFQEACCRALAKQAPLIDADVAREAIRRADILASGHSDFSRTFAWELARLLRAPLGSTTSQHGG